MDLKDMTRAELAKLRDDVDKALKNAEVRELRAARKAAEQAAGEYGYTLAQLATAEPPVKTRGNKGKAAKPGKPKYRNPENPKQTWTGKGRRPAWFAAAIDAGKSAGDLEI